VGFGSRITADARLKVRIAVLGGHKNKMALSLTLNISLSMRLICC
jgi:hypothetical protein